MSDDILFLIGFLFVVLLAFTFSHANPQTQKNAGVFQNASSTTIADTSRMARPATRSDSSSVSKTKTSSLSRLSPRSGPVGTEVTVYGSGFLSLNNVVHFGAKDIFANSADGKTLTFKVPALPAQVCPGGAQSCVIPNQNIQTSIGTYQVYVYNVNGRSNTLSFSVNDSSISAVKRPKITGVTGPKQILPNDPAVWALALSVSQPTTLIVSVDWGDSKVVGAGQTGTRRISITKSQTTTLGHSYKATGKYTIVFKVIDEDTGLLASYSVPVNVIYAAPVKSSPLTLSSLSQSSGAVGTQIVLNGAGFSASPVTIHFGDSAVRASPQNYGTALYFNVPVSTSAGSYPVYVSNDLGQITKTIIFRVTNP